MALDPQGMRARFHELGKQRDQVVSAAAAKRAEFEALRAQEHEIRQKQAPIIEQLRQIEAPLYEIDTERAALARALNGKTGEPT